MIKLVIQIPSYNEEEVLPETLKRIPEEISGIDSIEILVIDDGSTDSTADTALEHGADHILKLPGRKGLAKAFSAGIHECLRLGADIIVNTDADNQYSADNIKDLVQPILSQDTDIVIGARPISDINSFSPIKKFLQIFGSYVVRKASGTSISDAPSGFRAFSRDAAMKINVFDTYTYTIETLFQAGEKNMTVLSIPIMVNETTRPSRLVKNIFSYVFRSVKTIIRMYLIYKPFRFFSRLGILLFSGGFIIGMRFLYFFFSGSGAGHIQSLILSSVLLGMGFQLIIFAFIAELLSVNRSISEDIQHRLKKIEYNKLKPLK